MSWPTTVYNGEEWYIFDGITLIPVTPGAGAAILLLRPQGGMGINIPAIATGDPGDPALFEEGPIAFTELDHDDPTAAGLTVTQVSPGLFALSGALHAGAPGQDGTTSLDVDTIAGSKVAGKIIKLNSGLTGFDYAYEAVGERYLPASINNTAAGNPNSTLTTISIPARNRDYRLLVTGAQNVVQNGGSNVVVDLVARLNNETSGNIVARCHGIGGTERLTFASAPAAGSNDAFDKVTAGNAANVYIRTEQQSGSNSYTTSGSTGRFAAWAIDV